STRGNTWGSAAWPRRRGPGSGGRPMMAWAGSLAGLLQVFLRNDIERIHEVATVVGRPHLVDEQDVDAPIRLGIGCDRDAFEVDPRLPASDRLANGFLHEADGVGVDGREEQIPDGAAERRAHHPLPRRGAEHAEQRVADAV